MSALTPTLLQRLLSSAREPNARLRALKMPLDGKWGLKALGAIDALAPIAVVTLALDRPREVIEAATLIGSELTPPRYFRPQLRLVRVVAVGLVAAQRTGDRGAEADFIERVRPTVTRQGANSAERIARVARQLAPDGETTFTGLVAVARNIVDLCASIACDEGGVATLAEAERARALTDEALARLRAAASA